MSKVPAPLKEADLSQVRAVFTDVDGTLTEGGRLTSATVGAIEALGRCGFKVVLVSGRPSGWAECWARQLPVAGVIAENGGLYFAPRREGRVRKVYLQPSGVRRVNRQRLRRAVEAAMREVKGARLSMDSAAAEVDLAIDYAEEVSLGAHAAGRLERALRRRGASAVRSSVHVNTWMGRFDKRVAVRRFLRDEWATGWPPNDRRWVYLGDSFNDQPLFAAFRLSVGVANVLDLPLTVPPRFVTRRREGAGFRELARALLGRRRVR